MGEDEKSERTRCIEEIQKIDKKFSKAAKGLKVINLTAWRNLKKRRQEYVNTVSGKKG